MSQSVGPYEIISSVGAGGMGEVYAAWDPRLRRRVAVKLLHPADAASADRIRRFRQEAITASSLNHPNILSVYDVGEHEGAVYLVSELLEGQTVRERLVRGRIPLTKVLQYATAMANALAAVHEKGIVHRDIKPENLFITTDDRLKLLDFGVAKLRPDESPGAASATAPLPTSPGMAVGTLAYMAPEQVRGEDVDGRTDLFAVGCVLVEMLTGIRAFWRPTASATAVAVLQDDPAGLREVAAISPALRRIIDKCLEKVPAHRYRSAQELAMALETFSSSGLTVAQSGGSHRGMVIAAVAGAVVLSLVPLWFYLRPKSAIVIPQPIRSAAPRSSALAILPFQPLGPAGDDILGVGLADAIITKISQTGGVIVRPTSAVRRYSGPSTDSLAAARELQVDTVVDGTLQRADRRLRVSVNLLRVRDGASLWADSFDVPVTDIFMLQDTVAARVVEMLRLRLTPDGRRALTRHYTSSPEAYEDYARGKDAFDRRIGDPAALQEAVDRFRKAIAADPGYALAHARLAHSYIWMALFMDSSRRQKWLPLAKAELEAAQRLDPDLAETHVARHDLLWSDSEGYRIADAVHELEAAQRLDPSAGHSELATMYFHVGLEKQAVRELNKTMQIDPLSEVNQYHLTEGLALLGRHAQAIAASERYFHRPGPLLALLAMKRYDDADRWIRSSEAMRDLRTGSAPGTALNPFLLTCEALLVALRGDHERAIALVDEGTRKAPRENRAYHHTTYNAAAVYALAGRSAEAVHWLQVTADYGMPNYPLFARDPHLDRIRSSPEYRQFMASLERQWRKYQSEFR